MNGSAIAMISALGLALILPAAALRGRRLDWARGWRMAAIWFALFALAAMGFRRLGL